ncbi:MAG: hypothetical protein PHN75_00805 [Syntrophales bacterium]|nr:hypothetical protein [Syntrophales bacterium]
MKQNSNCIIIMIAAVFVFCGCAEKPAIIEQKCGNCHSASVVYKKKRSMDEWDRILFGMKARGLKVSPEEEKEILDVLEKRYSRQ